MVLVDEVGESSRLVGKVRRDMQARNRDSIGSLKFMVKLTRTVESSVSLGSNTLLTRLCSWQRQNCIDFSSLSLTRTRIPESTRLTYSKGLNLLLMSRRNFATVGLWVSESNMRPWRWGLVGQTLSSLTDMRYAIVGR